MTDHLNYVQVLGVDRLEGCSFIKWNLYSGAKISNGVLEVIGQEFWKAGLSHRRDFSEGEGVILRFKYTEGSEFEMMFDYGNWDTEPYRRFGVYVRENTLQSNLWQGKNRLGGENLIEDFKLEPDTWYNLMIVANKNGEFMALMWDPDDPSRLIKHREWVGEGWAGLSWTFKIGANKGIVLTDEFTEISFSEIK